MTYADIPAGLNLCRSAAWNQLEDDWRAFLHLPGGQCFIAENERGVVGTAASLLYGKMAWIAMMLVDPRERRSGIGSQLLQRLLFDLRDVQCIGLDATSAGEPLYRRNGFVDGPRLVRMKAASGLRRLTTRPGRVRRMENSDLPEVLERDREIFGAERGALLIDLFRRDPQGAWISPEGYCFGRPGHLYRQIGPIVADNADAAGELLGAHDGQAYTVDAPLHASQWLSRLESAGFVAERPFLRMYHRDGEKPQFSPCVFGIAGPEFG